MLFFETPLPGAYIIELDKKGDDRGFFARFFCVEEFKAQGLEYEIVQINNSLSAKRGTLRGMHYQLQPKEETKIVRCVRGALFDVILDVRPESKTFGQWYGVYLSSLNRKMLWIPAGFAHGFYVKSDWAEFVYKTTDFYAPEWERTILWNDPDLAIKWPIKNEETPILSKKDMEGSLLKDAEVFSD